MQHDLAGHCLQSFPRFFPALLIAVALATSRLGGKDQPVRLIADLTQFLPPRQPGNCFGILGEARPGSLEDRGTGPGRETLWPAPR